MSQAISMFKRKTVDGVMSAFNVAIKDLDDVRSRELAEAERQEVAAATAATQANIARAEAARALAVAEKLKSLVAA